MTRSLHRGTLKVSYRPELCAMPNHLGVAEQFVGRVLCRVHTAHRENVLRAWWTRQAEQTTDAEVSLLRKPESGSVKLLKQAG